MPYLIRKLEKKIWLDIVVAKEIGGLQADALKNFKTTENKLSVYQIENIDDRTLVIRVLAAIAAGRDKPGEIDYAIFDSMILKKVGINVEQIEGDTADQEINKLHLDLTQLKAEQILFLAEYVQKEGILERISKREITQSLTTGLEKGKLLKSKVNLKLLNKLRIS